MAYSMLAERDRMELPNGMMLRLLSAFEIMQARREAEELTCAERERALCANACLVARALEVEGKPLFLDGEAVLMGLRMEEIADLARRWGEFNRAMNPSVTASEETVETLKKN